MTASEGPSRSTTVRVTARRLAAPAVPAADLPAKLRPPTARVSAVERRALLEALAEAPEPLVLICAPAGTGKTTALRQWIEADGRPAAWVQLDASDDDPVVLLIYLARALGAVTDIDPGVERSLGLAVPPVRERVLPMLADALAAAPPFVLVLDDAHLLRQRTSAGRSWPSSCAACLRAPSWPSARAPTRRSRSPVCGRPASWPSSARRSSLSIARRPPSSCGCTAARPTRRLWTPSSRSPKDGPPASTSSASRRADGRSMSGCRGSAASAARSPPT